MDENKRLICNEELIEEKNRRLEKYEYLNESDFSKISQMEELGWEIARKYKNHVRFRRERKNPFDEEFENQVWLLFNKLGFSYMNKGRFFKLSYSDKGENLTQQIDVFAADEESIIIIECKSSKTLDRKTSFKTDIEAIGGKRGGLIAAAKKLFPLKKLKVKFVFATKNYALSKQDKDRMADFGIVHFDEDSIKYYEELLNHLGVAARYQLLGNLFEGQKIPEIHSIVPAIEGEMGSHKYYSFSIEPEKLLKMGFVLHHDNAYKDEMPAYQRIIKKNRLKAVQEFVDNGGFFPNSIIISINTKSKLQFDKSSLQDEQSISKIGLLHLPQEYKSIYIIDGQHRLYGYSNSKWQNKNTIPVVAFVNLEKEEQIQLFMDINENQKAVPKNLRTTLEADLLWNSEDYNERRKAISSRIAQRLGENKDSSLYKRIITGENTATPFCCVTLDIITKSLKISEFYNKYKKQDVLEDGIIDKGSNDSTYNLLYDYICSSFNYLSDSIEELWKLDTSDDNCIICNTFIYGFIRIFADILKYLKDKNLINPKTEDIDNIIDACKPYIDVVAYAVQEMPSSDKIAFRKQYGRVGDKRFWMTLRQKIHDVEPQFNPEGLEEFWRDNSMKYNEEAFKIIRDIELYLKAIIIEKLQAKYGNSWFRQGCPKSVYDAAQKLAADKNYEKEDGMPDDLPQDQLHLIDYRDIALYGSNWSVLFEKILSDPSVKGDKKKKTEWMQKLNTIRNQNFHTYSVTEEEITAIKTIKKWLIKDINGQNKRS